MKKNGKAEFYKYCKNCKKAHLLQQQIQNLEYEIEELGDVLDTLSDDSNCDYLIHTLHKKRVQKLGLELEFNHVDRQIIQFQLEEELEG